MKKKIVSRFPWSSPTRPPERVGLGKNPGNEVEDRPWKLDWLWTCYRCSEMYYTGEQISVYFLSFFKKTLDSALFCSRNLYFSKNQV